MPSTPAKPFGLVSTEFWKRLGAVLAHEAGGEHRRVIGERRVARRRRAIGGLVAPREILEALLGRRREPASDQRRVVQDARIVPLAGAEELHLVARDAVGRELCGDRRHDVAGIGNEERVDLRRRRCATAAVLARRSSAVG